MSKEVFNPKILGFLCNWCCYAAADAAGVSRFQYPPNIRPIRIPRNPGAKNPQIPDRLSVDFDVVGYMRAG